MSGASSRDRFYERLARDGFQVVRTRPLEFTYLSGIVWQRARAQCAALPDTLRSCSTAMVSQDLAGGENFLPIEYLDRLARTANRPIYQTV